MRHRHDTGGRRREARAASPPASETAEVRRITWIGLVANLLLAAVKFAAGFLGSSQAVVADAVHSLSDTATDLAILLGVRFWSAPPDEGHPYGHRRIETMITASIGVLLFLVAIGIGYHAVLSVRAMHLARPGWIAFAGAALSIVVKEILYRWTIAVGGRVRSSAVIANAWHHRSDALSSIPAAAAVIAALIRPGWAVVDHLGAVVVCFFIIHASWKIVAPAFAELADAGAPEPIRERIGAVARAMEDVKSVHAVRTRRMGSGVFVDMHVTVNGGMTVRRGHQIAEEVKRRLLEYAPAVVDVVVHLEPEEAEPAPRAPKDPDQPR
ncbi:MAG: cation transporter [Candidatus Eisenbacteria bacterium]|nr:cation transporter [Candidatus Eisenbacteria bacterium]